jgi:carbonic anhydrase/acetyltransferase-like protein (isoleucine patch superfamily)
MTNYRSLTDKEIATLTVYGCSAENWKNVMVSQNFSPNYISNVHFSGNNFLGTYEKVFENNGGLKKHSGIYNSVLHNCTIGNDVFIDKINNYIANYHIEDGAYIENVNLMVVDALSPFGNGVKVAVMIENGAREISMFDSLTSQFAFLSVFYRQQTKMTSVLESIVEEYSELQLSETGKIGKNVYIVNCGQIRNVRIGDSANLSGVTLLENGTIVSNEQAPVSIGAGVQCNDFIIQSGSAVSESAIISRCFIGQGCLIGKQFSAIDSLFFANCQGLHGEAVSVFAGPYTVTHHKSTLMLTALYSFMNAGSGTNFSNHMYKLGPVHQGITERGVKTSSNSYIMWPAKIGAFTAVLGSHKGNSDISELPFSYLIENDGVSNLLPGINLISAGTIRDVQKWPKRDLRKDELKLDLINFNFLSPFTLCKALNGIDILKGLLQNQDDTSSSSSSSSSSSFVWYQNCKIKRSSLKKGIELYEMAIDQFIGSKMGEKLSDRKIETQNDLFNLFSSDAEIGKGDWVDMVGLLAPKSEVDSLLNHIETENVSLEAIQKKLNEIHSNYVVYSWNWAKDILQKLYGKSINEFDIQDIILVIEKWKKSVLTFNDLILRDAKKEFNTIAKTGFGMNGNEADKQLDFESVRGTYDENSFVKDINNQTNITISLADKLICQLANLQNN